MNTTHRLAVECDLTLDLEPEPAARTHSPGVRIRARGDRIGVDFATLRSARLLLSSWPRGESRREGLRALRSGLARSGLVIEAFLRGHCIARVSGTHRGSRLANWVGLPGVEMSLAGWLRAATTRRVADREPTCASE